LISLEHWVAVATLVGNVTLVITLLFVGLQVRQAERNQRALMQQGRADRIGQQSIQVAASRELAHVFNTGMFEPQKLTREEFAQYLLIGRALFVSAEDSFLQHKEGMLDATAFHSQTTGLRRMMIIWPGARALWRIMATQYGEDFRHHMDEIVRAAAQQPAPDLFTAWQVQVRSEIVAPEPPRTTAP
jgi:hypothetical protein